VYSVVPSPTGQRENKAMADLEYGVSLVGRSENGGPVIFSFTGEGRVRLVLRVAVTPPRCCQSCRGKEIQLLVDSTKAVLSEKLGGGILFLLSLFCAYQCTKYVVWRCEVQFIPLKILRDHLRFLSPYTVSMYCNIRVLQELPQFFLLSPEAFVLWENLKKKLDNKKGSENYLGTTCIP
jgi:hypothetical protein